MEIRKAAKSTYNSLGDANYYTNQVIDRNKEKIDSFLNSPWSNELWIESRFGNVTGKEAVKFSANASPRIRTTHAAGTLLRKEPNSKNGFTVITSYPMNED